MIYKKTTPSTSIVSRSIKKYRYVYVVCGVFCSLLLIVRRMIHYTLYSPTNIIHHVVIDPISAAYLDSQSLFDRLHSLLSGYNITDASRWYYQDIKDRMHVIEPFIEKFTITKQSNNTIMLSIQRKKPELIIHNGSEHMARW